MDNLTNFHVHLITYLGCSSGSDKLVECKSNRLPYKSVVKYTKAREAQHGLELECSRQWWKWLTENCESILLCYLIYFLKSYSHWYFHHESCFLCLPVFIYCPFLHASCLCYSSLVITSTLNLALPLNCLATRLHVSLVPLSLAFSLTGIHSLSPMCLSLLSVLLSILSVIIAYASTIWPSVLQLLLSILLLLQDNCLPL